MRLCPVIEWKNPPDSFNDICRQNCGDIIAKALIEHGTFEPYEDTWDHQQLCNDWNSELRTTGLESVAGSQVRPGAREYVAEQECGSSICDIEIGTVAVQFQCSTFEVE